MQREHQCIALSRNSVRQCTQKGRVQVGLGRYVCAQHHVHGYVEFSQKAREAARARPRRPPSVVRRLVADYFGLTERDLYGRARTQTVARARQVACFLERERGRSYPTIGELYGRDSSTALAAVRHVAERIRAGDRRYIDPVGVVRDALGRGCRRLGDPCPACGAAGMTAESI